MIAEEETASFFLPGPTTTARLETISEKRDPAFVPML
jgi:hypothetical protein